MKKRFTLLLVAVSVLSLAFGITLLTSNAKMAKAEIVTGTTPAFSETKVLRSTDGAMMLLATGINDYQDCYECGYITEGLQAVTYNLANYYTSISVNGGAKTWTVEDIFDDYYQGMIVWEVKNISTETSFTPYVRVGDRENGILVASDTVEYGTERTLDCVVGVSSSLTGMLLSQELDDFADSGKALTFEYKATGASSGTDTALFTLWTADGSKRLTGIFTLDVEAATLSGADGKVESIGNDWYRVTINCSDMPINTAEGADGSETIGQVFFNTVNHAFLVANAEFVDEDIHIGAATFAASAQKDYYFVKNYETSGVELDMVAVFDVKFTTSGSLTFYLNEYYYGRFCGPFTLTSGGVFSGNGASSCESIGDGWYRIKTDLTSASKSATEPAFVSRVNIQNTTSAAGLIKYMGEEEPDIHEGATAFDSTADVGYYFITPEDNGNLAVSKIAVFDVNFTSGAGTKITFLLREYFRNRYFGYYSVFKSGALGGTYPGVSTEVLDDGWIRIRIDLADATPQGSAAPTFVSKIEIKATTTGSDYTTASGKIKYMGYEEPDIHKGATEFDSSADLGYYFITPEDNGNVAVSNTIAFDVKFTSGAGTKITFLLREYYRNRYFGYYSVFKSGTLGGTYPGVSTEVLDDGWIRIKIDLSAATPQGSADPTFVSKIEIKATTTGTDYTTASGLIKYMGVID